LAFYGDRGDEQLDESAAPERVSSPTSRGGGRKLASAAEPFARVVILRLGIVLAAMVVPSPNCSFRSAWSGRPMGTGRQ